MLKKYSAKLIWCWLLPQTALSWSLSKVSFFFPFYLFTINVASWSACKVTLQCSHQIWLSDLASFTRCVFWSALSLPVSNHHTSKPLSLNCSIMEVTTKSEWSPLKLWYLSTKILLVVGKPEHQISEVLSISCSIHQDLLSVLTV